MFLINLISLYLLSVSVAVVFCAVNIRLLNGVNYIKTAMLLCFAICFYILGYAMELNSSTPSQILFWNRMEYIGIPFVSALWLTIALMYTGHFARHKKILLAAIYVIPIASLILRLTNDYHHLYFASVAYVQNFGMLFFVKQIGPWMHLQMLHSALMILISMGLFISDPLKNAGENIGKILIIIAASVFAVAGLILTQVKPFGFQIDYMALCLPVTSVLIILAISRYDLLRTKSIARCKVFEASKDAILMLDPQNNILDYNNSAKLLFERQNIHLKNAHLSMLLAERPDLLIDLKKTEPTVVKLRINNDDRYYDITTENIDNHDTLGWIKTIRDVTEIYQLNEELKQQAMTDELSVLSNRRAFINIGREWVSVSEEKGSVLHLLMMDLDYFKNVNDLYGHPTGDLVIREFAQILKSYFNDKCLVARLGGEEFAVLQKGFDDKEMRALTHSFLIHTEQHVYSYFKNEFHVTVSIGMTMKQSGQTLESMMRTADMALYQSKERHNCLTVL